MNHDLWMYKRALLESKRKGLARFLFEAGEDEKEEESADEETADDDAEDSGDEGTDEAGEGTEDDDSGGDDADEGEAEEDEAEAAAEQEKQQLSLKNSIDGQLEAQFAKAEREAVEAAKFKISDVKTKNESIIRSRNSRKLGPLYEAADPDPIDIEHFANRIARLVYNYDTLLDIESMIVMKAVDYIEKNYDEEMAEKLKKALVDLHDIDVSNPNQPPTSKLGVPNAVGARQAAT